MPLTDAERARRYRLRKKAETPRQPGEPGRYVPLKLKPGRKPTSTTTQAFQQRICRLKEQVGTAEVREGNLQSRLARMTERAEEAKARAERLEQELAVRSAQLAEAAGTHWVQGLNLPLKNATAQLVQAKGTRKAPPFVRQLDRSRARMGEDTKKLAALLAQVVARDQDQEAPAWLAYWLAKRFEEDAPSWATDFANLIFKTQALVPGALAHPKAP